MIWALFWAIFFPNSSGHPVRDTQPGTPDFSMCDIPKREKMYQNDKNTIWQPCTQLTSTVKCLFAALIQKQKDLCSNSAKVFLASYIECNL
jgi:hypothetical protein